MPNFGKTTPLQPEHFTGFIKAYTAADRKIVQDERWSVFTRAQIAEKGNSLDLGLIRDDSVLDYEDLQDPVSSGRPVGRSGGFDSECGERIEKPGQWQVMAKKKQQLPLEELLEQALVKDEDKPYEVPENWVWVRLGSVIKVSSGNGLTSSKMNSDGNIPDMEATELLEIMICGMLKMQPLL